MHNNMDLIKDRLAHILHAKNLTYTQFAEMMQIQPSNVSHLLSGRNKPSIDFLIKLKALFPEYSFDWIILGKKPITNTEPVYEHDNLFKHTEIVEREEPQIKSDSGILNTEIRVSDKLTEDLNEQRSISLRGLKQIIYVYDDHTFEVFENKL